MKHITLVAAMAVATGAMAQRPSMITGHPQHIGLNFSADRGPIDTLIPPSLLDPGSAFALYTSSAGSYVAGTNTFGDQAKVQVFHSTGTVHVEQLLFLFGAKDDNGTPNAVVHARVYGLDGDGTNTADETVSTAPGTVMGSVDIPISDCDTTDLTIATFFPSITVDGNFGGGFDVSDLGDGVALGLLTTSDGDPGTADDQNWEKFSDDSWVAMSNGTVSWGLHVDLAILAVLDDGFAGIHDNGAVNNMRMSFIGSNPASTSIEVAYDMLQDANARMTVLDGKGAKVIDQQLGKTLAGQHQITLNVSEWANGTYYVSLFANGAPITKKLVVKH
jgi:hypothetical protein